MRSLVNAGTLQLAHLSTNLAEFLDSVREGNNLSGANESEIQRVEEEHCR